jgi:hypothetical protein
LLGIEEKDISMSHANSSGRDTTDKRRYQRIKTSNIISYISIDEEGNEIEEGIGTALNISQGGLLLETYLPVKARFILILHIDVKGQLQRIKGEVVYSRPGDSGNFFVGVRFIDTRESQRNMTVSIVKAYHSRKKENLGKRNIP